MLLRDRPQDGLLRGGFVCLLLAGRLSSRCLSLCRGIGASDFRSLLLLLLLIVVVILPRGGVGCCCGCVSCGCLLLHVLLLLHILLLLSRYCCLLLLNEGTSHDPTQNSETNPETAVSCVGRVRRRSGK